MSRFTLRRPNDIRIHAAMGLRGAGIILLTLAALSRFGLAAEAASDPPSRRRVPHWPPTPASILPPPPMPTAAAMNTSADELLLLEVLINGRSTNKIGEFTLRHGTLMSRPEELQDLGFRIPATRAFEPGGSDAASRTFCGLTWTIDQQKPATACHRQRWEPGCRRS